MIKRIALLVLNLCAFLHCTFSQCCGEDFTDVRNGQSYRTVTIGNQCWMAENLNIGTQVSHITSQTDNSVIEKFCYDNNPSACNSLGGLYQWEEMMQYDTVESIQGVCPAGWHLPSDGEWLGKFNKRHSYSMTILSILAYEIYKPTS